MHARFSLGSTPRIAVVAVLIALTALIGGQPAFPQSTPSGPIRLVKDINPTNYNLANPVIIGEVGDELLFVQEVDPYGRELWATDGTSEGTRILADINPGIIDSDIELHIRDAQRAVTVVGNQIVLGGYDTFYNHEPRIYDLESGNLSVVDIVPNGSSFPREFVTYNGNVYFGAFGDGFNDYELWRIDVASGTAAQVADIEPGSAAAAPYLLTATPFGLFFNAATTTNGAELWVSDGTEAGTRLVKDISPGNESSDPYELTLLEDRLFFGATDESGYTDLWVSDGTFTNTVKISPADGSPTEMLPGNLYVFNGKLYFSAYDRNDNVALWVSDGTDAGTMPLIAPLSPYLFASNATSMFFIAADPDNDDATSIWKSDGTAEGTALVTALPNGVSRVQRTRMLGNKLVFIAQLSNGNRELWISDGTAEGTTLLKDIRPDGDDEVTRLYVLGDTVYFPANDGIHGSELWKSDGTAAGTMRVQPVERNAVSYVFRVTQLGDNALMYATDGVHGFELWTSDGTAAGTTLLKDINPGQANGIPFTPSFNGMTVWNGTAYFAANDGQHGSELWKSDGTTEGTVMAVDIAVGTGSSTPRFPTVFKDQLFFRASVGGDPEPWVSDGTAAGTKMLKDINPEESSEPSQFTVVGEQLVFVANDGEHGYELWRTDGTVTNTLLISDIYSGARSSDPVGLTVQGDNLFFSADDGVHGREIWQYDAQTGTVEMLRDLYPGAIGSLPSRFTVMSDGLVFKAGTPDKGVELVRLTDSGATVFDINPGTASSYPSWLTLVGDDLYFAATDGIHGLELWKVSPGGTPVLVRDIAPGADDSYPEHLIAAADGRTIVFKADDGVHGIELWRSDGRSTAMVHDLEPGSGSSSPVDFKMIGDQLYFVAAPSRTGMELFVLDGSDLFPQIYLPLVRH